MDNITQKAMVISSMPIGEYDRRVELLAEDLGKISAFARGARKPSSSLVSCSRPFAFGDFVLYQGKSAYSVNSASISNYFTELSRDIVLTSYGSYFLELCGYFCREGNPAKAELLLLYQSLRALLSEHFENRLVRAVFELKILSLQGLCPDAEYIKRHRDISKGCEYTYNFVAGTEILRLFTFKLKPEILEEFAGLTYELLRNETDKEFNSLILLETLGAVD